MTKNFCDRCKKEIPIIYLDYNTLHLNELHFTDGTQKKMMYCDECFLLLTLILNENEFIL